MRALKSEVKTAGITVLAVAVIGSLSFGIVSLQKDVNKLEYKVAQFQSLPKLTLTPSATQSATPIVSRAPVRVLPTKTIIPTAAAK